MPALLSTLSDLFGTNNLYEVLEIKKDAELSEITRAYRKKSLKVHPDRVPEDQRPDATKKFQALNAVHQILSDSDKRAVYNETGEVDDQSDAILNQDKDWNDYWRLHFKKITPDDIANFERDYRHSEEEMADLKQAYLDGKGSMEYILDNVLCCSDDDQERFQDIIMRWIEDEEVEFLPKFRRLTAKEVVKRKKNATKEAKEAEEHAQELGLGRNSNESDLINLIAKRQEQRAQEANSFLDGLAAKYGGSSAKKSKKKK